MDLFQRLLGTLQRTVDYLSTFTTYLLGDEAHPGAEVLGCTTETVPRRGHNDCDLETEHYGDISPGGDLKAFEGPTIVERILPSQEIQEAPGEDFSCAQATEAILGASKSSSKNAGQEDVGDRKFISEPPNFLADAPEPRSSTMGSIQQRDLEEPMVTGGFNQWEPEGSARMGAVQQELLEEMADLKDWKPEKPLARGQEHEELGRAGEAEGTWQKDLKETEGDEQEAPGEAESDGGEQTGLNGAAWTEGFQQQVAKMVEDQRSESDGELVGGANTKDNRQEEPDIEVGDGGVQPAVPDSAETVTEERDGEARGLAGYEAEGAQQEELEVFVRNEGTQQSGQEENEGDGRVEPGVEEQRGDATARTGRLQQEMVKMVEDLQSEPEGPLLGAENMEDKQQEESDIKAGDEGLQPAGLDSAETRGDQQGGPEGEAEERNSPQWEPEETVTLEVQEEDPEGVTEKEDGQQIRLEEAEMEMPQQGGLEGFVKNKAEQREQEENEGDEQEATSGEEAVMQEQWGERAACTGRVQQEMIKMVEDLQSEPDGPLLGGENMEDNQQEESSIMAGDEGVQPVEPGSSETRGDQQRGPEGEAEARSSPQWEPEETVTLEVQEKDPKGVTEKGDGQQIRLEEAEKEMPQQGGLEGFVRNERTQQEENEGDEQEATGGEESVREEPWEEGAAWTGQAQQEAAEGQCLKAEGQLLGGVEAENCQQGEPDMETGDKASQQVMLDGAEMGGDQHGGQEGEAEAGRNLQWEPEEAVTLEEHPEKGNGQQRGLEGAEERDGPQHGKLRGLVRSEAETEEEGQEEQMEEPRLERDQQTDPEAMAAITVLEEVVVAAVMEEPEVQGQEPQETERTKWSLLHEPLGDKTPVDTSCPTGAGVFPDEVPSLDTSAQKERVLLRRKSSIRRAPSLKRSRPPTETPPLQEMGIEENSPSQPPSSVRPNLRHAGFGPVHPNMMAELQMRLRRPQ